MWTGRYKHFPSGAKQRLYPKICKECRSAFEGIAKSVFCGRPCSNRFNAQKGEDNYFWNGGRVKDSMGYIRIWKPDHHRAMKGGYVVEHTLVLEEKLGRPLRKDEIAHHINEIKDDNRPENLEVTTVTEHKKHHGHHVTNVIKGKKGYQRKEPILTGPIPDKERFTVLEVAKLTGIGNSTMWKKVWNSEIDFYLDGKRRFVTHNALEVFVA